LFWTVTVASLPKPDPSSGDGQFAVMATLTISPILARQKKQLIPGQESRSVLQKGVTYEFNRTY